MIINYLVPEITLKDNFSAKKLINELSKASYAVWMLSNKNWLSDEALFSLLQQHLNNGLNVEIIMHDYVLSDYENARLQQFIDYGGEIFLIDNEQLNTPLKEYYCIVDYSTVVSAQIHEMQKLKPGKGSIFLKENKETLIDYYIEHYLNIKNKFCKNRY